jgi:anti-anti-sigma factor
MESPDPIVEITSPAPVKGGEAGSAVTLAVLRGEHDLGNAPALKRLLGAAVELGLPLVVDVSTTRFIDLSVIKVLKATRQAAQRRGQRFVLQWGTEPSVHEIFKQSGALSDFEWRSTRALALREASGPHREDGG